MLQEHAICQDPSHAPAWRLHAHLTCSLHATQHFNLAGLPPAYPRSTEALTGMLRFCLQPCWPPTCLPQIHRGAHRDVAILVRPRTYPIPDGPQETAEQALGAVQRAWAKGIKRQRVELLLPLIGATDLDDWCGPQGVGLQGFGVRFNVLKPVQGAGGGGDGKKANTTVMRAEG